jgi:hypothetical protein
VSNTGNNICKNNKNYVLIFFLVFIPLPLEISTSIFISSQIRTSLKYFAIYALRVKEEWSWRRGRKCLGFKVVLLLPMFCMGNGKRLLQLTLH